MLFTLLSGVLVGVLMGVTGAGGGILSVPALVYGLGWSLPQAAPVALVATCLGSAVGAVEGLRRRLVRYRAALLIALASLPFSGLGVRAAQHLPTSVLSACFAVVLLIVAMRLLRQQSADTAELPRLAGAAHINPDTGRFEWNARTACVFGLIGGVAGFMSGLLGVGGGFVVVPLLRRFSDASMHVVVATSLLIVALVSLGSLGNALANGAVLPAVITPWFAASVAAGMLVGRRIAHRLAAHHVQRGFAALLLIVAASLLLRL
ncbi:sulfite exporter TauE/SafE family protein [Uliginosibacterium sp. H1]|uniref:sulfite exporter TauE/SafE family protein n=1 Tax=Uliginosibacterium sp. H1 TaxID=3114757 RepID=UPI002E18A0D5|nr:sulfite exporter TauE/SafE family protein [Uliginosibacterium sp. H1]